ncbi:MAG: BlaI/MecI/CopY family transcriptional regulator [Candidatus Gastranaerophilales bacterium]|nr:BlaI/MecI/CopY family transcriptional regulator [Candidatus Gastranaerophilales bacterium]
MDRRHGNLENKILNALWKMEENDQFLIDVSNVQAEINSTRQKWAYTTVKTVLDRLVEKNHIQRIKQGKKYYYRSATSRINAGDTALKKVVKQYFNNDIEEMIKAANKILEEVLVIA